MNRIILLILLNILVYYLYNKNIHLLISLFIFMIYYTLKMSRTVEGNYYRYNFAKSLNDKVKTDREEGNLFNKIIRKLNSFLKRYMTFQEIPVQQPCVGRFNAWSKCNRDCGRGEQFRTFNIIQKVGSGGIKCIYENGAINKKECFNDKCVRGEECDDDLDCDTGYCDPVRKQCGLEYECTKNSLHNCGFDECEELGRHYHYNVETGCDKYIIKNIMQ